MSASNRAPGSVWCLRRDLRDYVRTSDGDGIAIHVGSYDPIIIDRPTARLLAKRINECLDATAKQ